VLVVAVPEDSEAARLGFKENDVIEFWLLRLKSEPLNAEHQRRIV
jgi:hypothetical protein